jgi:hypothetical protein
VLPRIELERPVGDDVVRVRPPVSVLLDGRPVHRQERVVAHLLHEPRLRGGQVDDERAVVGRLDADLVRERVAALLARVVVGCADDAVELVRVVGGEVGRDRPLPGPFEVLGGDGVAVRPLPVPTEMEGDGLPAVGHVPALGEARDRLQIVAQLHERVHDVEQDVGRGHVRREARIERRRLGPPRDRDHLVGRGRAGRPARGAGASAAAVRAAAACRCEHPSRQDQK